MSSKNNKHDSESEQGSDNEDTKKVTKETKTKKVFTTKTKKTTKPVFKSAPKPQESDHEDEKDNNWESMTTNDQHDNQSDDEQHNYIQQEDDEPETSQSRHVKYDRTDRKPKVRHTTSIINFDYSEYMDLETPIRDADNTTLLKVLIARSHKDGQQQLHRTVKQTLRACNLECSFPTDTKPLSSSKTEQSTKQKYDKKNRNF